MVALFHIGNQTPSIGALRRNAIRLAVESRESPLVVLLNGHGSNLHCNNFLGVAVLIVARVVPSRMASEN